MNFSCSFLRASPGYQQAVLDMASVGYALLSNTILPGYLKTSHLENYNIPDACSVWRHSVRRVLGCHVTGKMVCVQQMQPKAIAGSQSRVWSVLCCIKCLFSKVCPCQLSCVLFRQLPPQRALCPHLIYYYPSAVIFLFPILIGSPAYQFKNCPSPSTLPLT